MMKRKLLWLVLLIGVVLVGSSWLAEARADDTYNFYFQKAPGPVTVNQGGAAAASPSPDLKLKNESVVPGAPAPAAASAATAPAAPEDTSGVRNWELSLGIAGSRYSGDSSQVAAFGSPTMQSGMINAAQYAAGLQLNLSETVALLGEAFYLSKVQTIQFNDQQLHSQGSRLDYGAGLVITPFRVKAGPSTRLAFSALVGVMSVPYNTSGFDSSTGAADGLPPQIAHAGSLYYGGRAALELNNRISLQASIRRLDRYSATQGTGALALLF